MQIDQKEYVTPLYRQLSRLCTDKNSSHTELALKCLSLAFLKRREYSTVRVAAFKASSKATKARVHSEKDMEKCLER
eukprot:3980589-Ditylum_brightwellii.AAC.1